MNFAIRVALWLIAHTIFRVRIVGRRNIPEHGPALLVSNHISYADGFLIAHCVKPPIRFMAWAPFFQMFGFRWILRLIRAIPVGFGGRRETMESIFQARQELAAGQLVCIFPEGSMTRDGELHPFKRGMEKIVEGLPVPIVPVRIDGLWGTVFGIEGERWRWRWPRRLPYRVTICFGDHMPALSKASEVRQAVRFLAGTDDTSDRKEVRRSG
jgi:acyl-[acyl-carrier-protein]-phospholipid O-acyltransferase/long-chain-fatty-acid--[acyl-carrier-protein] ligase